jgi:hypothetical protein
MRLRKLLGCAAVFIIAMLFMGTIVPAARAATPEVRIIGTPTDGKFNTGAIVNPEEVGTNKATVRLYYLDGSTRSMFTYVGVTIAGSGFTDYSGGTIGYRVEAATHHSWLNGPSGDVSVNGDGTFGPTVAYFRREESGKRIPDPFDSVETMVISMRDPASGNSIAGSTFTVNIMPTSITLPVGDLNPVTMFTGTDYRYDPANDLGVAEKIVTPDGLLLAGGANLSLLRDGNKISLEGGDVWDQAEGLKAYHNPDGSSIIFRTETEDGAAAAKPAEGFTIRAKKVFVANDGFALIFGTSAERDIASFSLEVQKKESVKIDSIEIPGGTLGFQVGVDTHKEVAVTHSPSDAVITGLLIEDADGGNPEQSKTLNGLTITADPATGKITFSGTPTEAATSEEGHYKIVAVNPDGQSTETDLNFEIAEADLYTASIQSQDHAGDKDSTDHPYWTVNQDIGTAKIRVIVSKASGDQTGEEADIPVTITVTEEDGSPISDPWHGLTIEPDSDGKAFTMTGTPTESGTFRFFVNVEPGIAGAKMEQSHIPFSITVGEDVTYQLLCDPQILNVPVGEHVSVNIDQRTVPQYPGDITPRTIYMEGGGDRAEDEIHWNGLTLTSWINASTFNFWIEVEGEALNEGSQEFKLTPTKGKNMLGTTFTINAIPHAPDPSSGSGDPSGGSSGDVPPADDPSDKPALVISDPVVISTNDEGEQEEIDEPASGKTSLVIYHLTIDNLTIIQEDPSIVPVSVDVTIETVSVQAPDGSGSIKLTHLSDNSPPAPNRYNEDLNAYYYDRANGNMMIYMRPQIEGKYIYHVYYRRSDKTELFRRPIVLNVSNDKSSADVGGGGGGGGCDTGAAGMALIASIAALGAYSGIRRKGRDL